MKNIDKHSANARPQLERPLYSINVGEFQKLVSESVANHLGLIMDQLKQSKAPKNDELVPRLDVAREFQVSVVSLDKWVKYGQFPKPIKQGSRVYFRRSDLDIHISKKGGQNEF